MADKDEDDRCVACDAVFYTLVFLTAAVVGAIAADYMLSGKLSEWLSGLVKRTPALAAVIPIRDETAGDSDAG